MTEPAGVEPTYGTVGGVPITDRVCWRLAAEAEAEPNPGPMRKTIEEIAGNHGLRLDDDHPVRLALYAAYRAGQWDEMMGLTVSHEEPEVRE